MWTKHFLNPDIFFKPDPPSPAPTPSPNATFLANQNIYETNDIPENIHEFYGVMKPTLFGNDSDHSGNEQLIGDVLIVCAQIIVASQMVYEEKVVSKYVVPNLIKMCLKVIQNFIQRSLKVVRNLLKVVSK